MYSIVWDLYNTDKYELMKLESFTINKENFENLGIAHLAKTSGNIYKLMMIDQFHQSSKI